MLPKLRGRSMSNVMRELGQVLHQEDASVSDILYPGLKALYSELLTSTVLDLGAAFPQVRVATLSRSRFALGRASEPLSWRSPAFRPIDLVFLILDPLKADVESRQLVSTLQNLGKNHSRLDDLRRASTAEKMVGVLVQVPLVAASELVCVPPIIAASHNRPARTVTSYGRWRR
jgi:mannitol/fructose-specific phosphotransferase system IIA component (Ntr-type)